MIEIMNTSDISGGSEACEAKAMIAYMLEYAKQKTYISDCAYAGYLFTEGAAPWQKADALMKCIQSA